jgi:DNA-binding NtrC family response regulator
MVQITGSFQGRGGWYVAECGSLPASGAGVRIHNKPDLLIVDDDPLISETLSFVLGSDYAVHLAASRLQVQNLLRRLERPPRLALVDLGLPPTPHRPDEGLNLVTELIALAPDMKVVVLSGQDEEANARHARTLGAFDFVAKPCEPEALKRILRSALDSSHAEAQAHGVGRLLGGSPPIEALRRQIARFASSPFPVLIEGESGTGKELIARALHEQSPRRARPFLALNCAAISPALVEPTLFGYARGAFTGATAARAGYFEDAQDSTLFLDEIGELPLELQAKLLRVLENGEFQRVGETQSRVSTARVVAATNRDMRRETRSGAFRADLYHRISVFTLRAPPLRDMGSDRVLLLEHFREFYRREAGQSAFDLDAAAMSLWLGYAFPGNVRELRNVVIRLTMKYAGQTVTGEELAAELDLGHEALAPGAAAPRTVDTSLEAAGRELAHGAPFDLDVALRRWERAYIGAALRLANGNLSRAARLLGVKRSTLYSRMQTHHELEP